MAQNTKIQWCDHTFNPWIGCSKVHLGCTNCYAEADMDQRRGRVQWGPNGTRSLTKTWGDPVKWNRQSVCGRPECVNRVLHRTGINGIHGGCPAPCGYCAKAPRPRVFCASLADVFEEWNGPIVDHKGRQLFVEEFDNPYGKNVDDPIRMDDLRADLFRLIDATPNLDWLLLTKRPENVLRMWPAAGTGKDPGAEDYLKRENCWLGTSVSDQETADTQIPELLKCRDLAAKLFVSAEPMLGPIDWEQAQAVAYYDVEQEWVANVDQIIFGGESGRQARPCNVQWIRDGVRQCREAGVAAFVKQLGAKPYACHGSHDRAAAAGPGPSPDCLGNACEPQPVIRDPKGGDPDEWSEDLRVRELPR